MTGMVQPDLGPPATKYKEDPIDDPVSIISYYLIFFFFSFSISPIDSVRCFLLQYHSYLSMVSICDCQLYVQWGLFSTLGLSRFWILISTFLSSRIGTG
jgi:hypothetical protein